MMYYVAREGQQYGPYSADTIRQYLAAGSLVLSDHAREENGQSWSTLGQFFPPAVQTPVAHPPVDSTPVAPQPYTSGPAYGQQPVYGQQQVYAQPHVYAQQPTYGQQPVMPPDLHWALVWLLSATGVFMFVWTLIQASYARKINQASKATVYYILWVVGSVITFGLYMTLGVMVLQNNGLTNSSTNALAGVVFLLWIGTSAFFIAGTYSIRASMLDYYNTREPIQLKLSGVMTFFFSILYLQYHMSRIANWKKTGYLTPQG